MIKMNPNYVSVYVKNLVDSQLQNEYVMEYGISVEDVDDLHDLTIESEDICQIDRVYDALCAMLPIVFDNVVEYIEDAMDEDVWGTMAMRESIGFCDF